MVGINYVRYTGKANCHVRLRTLQQFSKEVPLQLCFVSHLQVALNQFVDFLTLYACFVVM